MTGFLKDWAFQGRGLSPNDIQARIGKLTASRMADAMSFLKNGKESAARRQYKIDLVAERMTDVVVPHHVNDAMLHGIEFEAEAKELYAQITGRTIRPAAYIDHPTIDFFGATPDGYVEDDGLIQVKCPTTTMFIKWKLAGVIPEEHKPQIATEMLVTGKVWNDFFAYDPRMPAGKNFLLVRFTDCDDYLKCVQASAIMFLDEVDELFDLVNS
jgi:predicted phage-related endonuclease